MLADTADVELYVVVSDVHVPDHDRAAWAAFLDFLADVQPAGLVLAGDFVELESMSQHPGSLVSPGQFVHDIAQANHALDQVCAAAGGARKWYLQGNHETRLERATSARHPAMYGATSLPERLRLKERGITWLPEGRPLTLGHLRVVHGWWSSMHHAKKHLEEMGCSVMYGHTHRPQIFTKGTGDGQTRAAFGLPCMRTLDPDWMNGKPGGWLLGFGVVWVWPNRTFQAQLVTMTPEKRFCWAGKVYG